MLGFLAVNGEGLIPSEFNSDSTLAKILKVTTSHQ